MTKARLLSTAAVALTLGVAAALNAANAEDKKLNPEPAPAAQQNAPPAKIAPPINAGEHKAPMASETTGQATKEPVPGHVGADAKAKTDSKTDLKASSAQPSTKSETSADVKASGSAKSADKAADSNKASAATTGQGAAAGSAKLSTEQRTKISTVIKKQNVKPVHVNFSISVGTRVPPTVHYYPLPTEVVTIYPEWRGYDYILVGDQIVVIDPGTHEIVAIIEA